MATSFINFVKHAVAGSSKLKATITGNIYNIQIEKDLDNGVLVAKGDYVKPEVYKANMTVTGFEGVILDKAANGNWYVEVKDPGDAILILTTPLIYEEYTTAMKHESNFYNQNGDITRGYELFKGDIFELSAEGFVTKTPEKGKKVTVDTATNKLAVGA